MLVVCGWTFSPNAILSLACPHMGMHTTHPPSVEFSSADQASVHPVFLTTMCGFFFLLCIALAVLQNGAQTDGVFRFCETLFIIIFSSFYCMFSGTTVFTIPFFRFKLLHRSINHSLVLRTIEVLETIFALEGSSDTVDKDKSVFLTFYQGDRGKQSETSWVVDWKRTFFPFLFPK